MREEITETTAFPHPPLARPLLALLGSLTEVIEAFGAGYTKASGDYSEAPGTHVRHMLDYLDAFLEGIGPGLIEYQTRRRGTPDEKDPKKALKRIAGFTARVATLRDVMGGQIIRVRDVMEPDQGAVEFLSTVGREASLVHQHGVHHCAMIAAMARSQGVAVPAGFGFAPSTLAWQLSRSRAR